jgi:hypothetical protein
MRPASVSTRIFQTTGFVQKCHLRSVSERWLFTRTNRNMQPSCIAQLQHIVRLICFAPEEAFASMSYLSL